MDGWLLDARWPTTTPDSASSGWRRDVAAGSCSNPPSKTEPETREMSAALSCQTTRLGSRLIRAGMRNSLKRDRFVWATIGAAKTTNEHYSKSLQSQEKKLKEEEEESYNCNVCQEVIKKRFQASFESIQRVRNRAKKRSIWRKGRRKRASEVEDGENYQFSSLDREINVRRNESRLNRSGRQTRTSHGRVIANGGKSKVFITLLLILFVQLQQQQQQQSFFFATATKSNPQAWSQIKTTTTNSVIKSDNKCRDIDDIAGCQPSFLPSNQQEEALVGGSIGEKNLEKSADGRIEEEAASAARSTSWQPAALGDSLDKRSRRGSYDGGDFRHHDDNQSANQSNSSTAQTFPSEAEGLLKAQIALPASSVAVQAPLHKCNSTNLWEAKICSVSGSSRAKAGAGSDARAKANEKENGKKKKERKTVGGSVVVIKKKKKKKADESFSSGSATPSEPTLSKPEELHRESPSKPLLPFSPSDRVLWWPNWSSSSLATVKPRGELESSGLNSSEASENWGALRVAYDGQQAVEEAASSSFFLFALAPAQSRSSSKSISPAQASFLENLSSSSFSEINGNKPTPDWSSGKFLARKKRQTPKATQLGLVEARSEQAETRFPSTNRVLEKGAQIGEQREDSSLLLTGAEKWQQQLSGRNDQLDEPKVELAASSDNKNEKLLLPSPADAGLADEGPILGADTGDTGNVELISSVNIDPLNSNNNARNPSTSTATSASSTEGKPSSSSSSSPTTGAHRANRKRQVVKRTSSASLSSLRKLPEEAQGARDEEGAESKQKRIRPANKEKLSLEPTTRGPSELLARHHQLNRRFDQIISSSHLIQPDQEDDDLFLVKGSRVFSSSSSWPPPTSSSAVARLPQALPWSANLAFPAASSLADEQSLEEDEERYKRSSHHQHQASKGHLQTIYFGGFFPWLTDELPTEATSDDGRTSQGQRLPNGEIKPAAVFNSPTTSTMINGNQEYQLKREQLKQKQQQAKQSKKRKQQQHYGNSSSSSSSASAPASTSASGSLLSTPTTSVSSFNNLQYTATSSSTSENRHQLGRFILPAVRLALDHINNNNTILGSYKLEIVPRDTQVSRIEYLSRKCYTSNSSRAVGVAFNTFSSAA